MAKLARPRVVSKDDVGIDLPDEVSVALREIAATAKQGLLALSVGRTPGSPGDLRGASDRRRRREG